MISFYRDLVFSRKLFYHLPMSFNLKSVGKNCPFKITPALRSSLILVFMALGLMACASADKTDVSTEIAEPASPEVSISGDLKTIEELRKNIPEPKKSDNDLLRETLSLMGEVKDPPHRIREKFQRTMRKIQDQQRKVTGRERDQFNKNEKRQREVFLKNLKKERDQFTRQKADREASKEFFAEQDLKRKEFFADQKDKRKEFDSVQKQKADDFKAMIRDRRLDFDSEFRNYNKRYDEWIKNKAAQKNKPTSYEPIGSGN